MPFARYGDDADDDEGDERGHHFGAACGGGSLGGFVRFAVGPACLLDAAREGHVASPRAHNLAGRGRGFVRDRNTPAAARTEKFRRELWPPAGYKSRGTNCS
jgi:hypothetical protein